LPPHANGSLGSFSAISGSQLNLDLEKGATDYLDVVAVLHKVPTSNNLHSCILRTLCALARRSVGLSSAQMFLVVV
jgi:hypothetical protein